MSQKESFQERTEQATPKRLADAKKKGQIARSRELTTTVVMLAGGGILVASGSEIGSRLLKVLYTSFSFSREALFDPRTMLTQFSEAVFSMLIALLPLFGALSAAAILASVALGGWAFSPQSLGFKLERISIPKGLKRIFSVRGLVELSKALAKFGLIAVVAYFYLNYLREELIGLSFESPRQALAHAADICLKSLFLLSLTLIVVAAIDVPFQLWQHQKNMKMSRQEVRDEQKDTDGKPEVKAKIRMLQQQQANARMMEEVPNANVVITNPTHFAVAIKYSSDEMDAPVVVAKGRDHIAARIREIAKENNVPMFEAPPLARVLYRTTRVGKQIPYELYKAVAQVLAYVIQLADYYKGGRYPQRPDAHVDESDFQGPGFVASDEEETN